MRLMQNPSKEARMHTAEHILFRALQLQDEQVKLDKIKLGEDESSFYISSENLDWEKVLKAEEQANRIVDEKRKVSEEQVPKAEAAKMKELRIKLERIKENTVRVIRIEDYDLSACSGDHCASTGLVGNILVTRFNSMGGGRYQVRYKIGALSDLYEMAGVARLASEALGTEMGHVTKALRNLISDEENYRNRYRELSKDAIKEVNREKVGTVDLIHSVYEDLEHKQLVESAGQHASDSTVVCFFNKKRDQAQVIISTKHPKLRADELLKIVFELGGKGGGRENFAMGSVGLDHIETVLSEIKRIISETIR